MVAPIVGTSPGRLYSRTIGQNINIALPYDDAKKAKELALELDLVTPLRLVGKTEDEVRDIIIEEVTKEGDHA